VVYLGGGRNRWMIGIAVDSLTTLLILYVAKVRYAYKNWILTPDIQYTDLCKIHNVSECNINKVAVL
jgi:hypothetical protein